ncbi:MAG: hypothetical protein ACM3TN_28940 [Alphaproteobacteria bacterium]
MGRSRPERASGPEIELRQLSAERNRRKDSWRIGWRLKNQGRRRLRIQAVKLPHGQFKSEQIPFEPAIDLSPDEETEFQTLVRCDEPPGDVTENAFVILYVIWLSGPWRVFVRLRVVVGFDGKPQATTESVTTQRIGFSQKDLA